MRIRSPLRQLPAACESSRQTLATGDIKLPGELQVICGSDVFWGRLDVVQLVSEPLVRFLTWVLGCDRHGHLPRQSSDGCPLTGCRAPSFPKALVGLSAQLQHSRAGLVLGGAWRSRCGSRGRSDHLRPSVPGYGVPVGSRIALLGVADSPWGSGPKCLRQPPSTRPRATACWLITV